MMTDELDQTLTDDQEHEEGFGPDVPDEPVPEPTPDADGGEEQGGEPTPGAED